MRRIVVVFVVLWAVAAAPVTAAHADEVVQVTSCGQVITSDAVLRRDLTCAGTAIWVEASGVTVRLGHHRITSTDAAGIGV